MNKSKNDDIIIWSDCGNCQTSTRHELLKEHTVETDPEYYRSRTHWQIIRCMGCFNICFRYQYDDLEDVWEVEDGDWNYSTKSEIYPKILNGYNQISDFNDIPDVIEKIYKQTLISYKEKASVLASIGLRGTIEAVCNNLDIPKGNLEKRIDQLFKRGFVSSTDKNRLHAIRFLGNDAAHEIKEPKKSEMKIALDIINHRFIRRICG